ncbi:MAG: hypothetical protein ACLGRW_15500 [Acidobacteriota bacterium]
MNCRFTTAAAGILAVGLVASYAFASGAPPAQKKHTSSNRAKTPSSTSLEEQIQALRNELQSQIDSLKNELATKDEQLKQAQQSAAAAQAAAAKAEAAAQSQQQTLTENKDAVTALQSSVNSLKGTQATLATTVTNTSKVASRIREEIGNPDSIHFKGITISPTGSFLAAETDYRSGATGGGLNTAFTAIPLQHSDDAQISEFGGTGRQSRVAVRATGQLKNMVLTGYYEMDWLGTGITSNNNQSNSYVLRQRQLWADAKLIDGWDFSGGQGWSLAAETTQGLTRGTEILPATIDPQYEAGFVWTRQYSFRVSKNIGKAFFMGISAENAQTLNPAGTNLPTNFLEGSAGNGGGLYNPTANYSFNLAPDMIAKIAVEPGWGHWELFGISRFFRDRVYPNAPASSAGAYNDTTVVGGVGGGFRGPLFGNRVSIGLKGLWGQGMGRYGSSTIADVTLRPDGQLAPLRAFSALSTVELNPTARLNVYLNYGGDYVYRRYFGNEGYGSPLTNMSGCNTQPVPGTGATNGAVGYSPNAPPNCGGNNKDVQEFTAGYWFYFYKGPKGGLRQGIQYSHFRRDLWSGAGGPSNPGGGAFGTDDTLFTSFRYYLP